MDHGFYWWQQCFPFISNSLLNVLTLDSFLPPSIYSCFSMFSKWTHLWTAAALNSWTYVALVRSGRRGGVLVTPIKQLHFLCLMWVRIRRPSLAFLSQLYKKTSLFHFSEKTHLIILVPGQGLGREDEPVLFGSPLHDADVVDCQPALPDHLMTRWIHKRTEIMINSGHV